MTDYPAPSITVNVDVTNPGQFFACCGLLELADRLWPDAQGWFDQGQEMFNIACVGSLRGLVNAIATAELIHTDPEDTYSSPLTISTPLQRPLCIDWWKTDRTGAQELKVWAGSMESFSIALAMQQALQDEQFCHPDLFNIGLVVRACDNPKKKKEPYYFDGRRTHNAHPRDVGFSPNDLKTLTSFAYPAVEFLCLVGLQVARPALTSQTRVYEYFTWCVPLLPNLVLAASTGKLDLPGRRKYRFEVWFRTGQKKHKGFRCAIPLT